ncbi:type VII secretion protein [Streptomyces sp. NPDC001351]|uniref:MinD/ParA family ATP-binding protein n=1 Tax=Streptomyces sp. NPDC001351 TaxID=3364564 RepID=UPI0036765BBE
MTSAQGGGWQDEVLRELRGGAPTPVGPETVANANDASERAGFEPGATASLREGEGVKAPLPVRHPAEQRPNPGQPTPPQTDSATPSDIPPHPPTNPPRPAEQLPQPVSDPPHTTPYRDATAPPVPARNPQGQSAPTARPSSAPPAASGRPVVRHRPAGPALPFPTPESLPTIDPRLALALGKPSHGDSIARRTGQTIRRLTSSASQEVAEETRIGRELQQPVTTGRVIAVTSIRGGVGKTTTTALLARTFNHYRHDPVLALEADAALGTLPVRLGAESVRWSCTELAHILTPQMQLTDITGYLVPVTDGGWLLPASQGRLGPPLDIRTYRTVTLALRRYFSVTLVDCETLPGEVARTAMDTAHARVVVAPLTAEGVGGTRVVLDWLAQLPHEALASTVVALTSGTPDQNLDLKTATAHLRETGVTIVHLPYDRHLAAGGPIRTQLLGSGTRRAATQLAAQALQRAVRVR